MSDTLSSLSNGGVNSSIPLQAGRGVQQPNPLQQIGQFANTVNALNQAKMFPGALALQGGQQTLQDQEIQSGHIGLQQRFNQAVANSMVPLLQSGQPFTHSNTTAALGRAEGLGLATNGWTAYIAAAPQGDGPAYDSYIRNGIVAFSQPAGQAVAAVSPGQQNIDVGTAIQPVLKGAPGTANQGQILQAPGAVQTYPSRAAQLQQVTWKDQNGVEHFGTNADWATARGQNSLISAPVPVGSAGTQPPAQPPGQSILGTGHYPAAAPGTSMSGPMPGTVQNEEASALSAHSANQRAATFASDIFPIQQAQMALANAPTGKGSQAIHDVSSYLNTFAPPVLQKALSFISPIMTPDEVTAFDEAKKYTTQVRLGAPGATRSNEGLETAGAASPSVEISRPAAQLVLRGMLGLRRMEQDATLTFNKSGLPPAAYDKFQSEFATKADPRVYTFDQMTPAQRAQTLASFGKPADTVQGRANQKARSDFVAQVEGAERNGIISAQGAQNAQ